MRKNVRLLSVALFVCASVAFAQAPSSTPASSLSELFKPSMASLVDTVNGLQIDKWKISKENRDQLASYLNSMQRDVNDTLPGLITTADSAPDKTENLLAVSQNVGALYDVLVRVAATSEVAGSQQANALNQVAIQLRDARRRLDDAILKQVASHQQKIADLQTSLNKANSDLATAKAAATQGPPPTTTKKTTKKRKATSQTNSQE